MGRTVGMLAAAAVAWAGCGPADPPSPPAPSPAVEAIVGDGALLYVPVYSHIFYRDAGREIDLAATLSVRNADPARPVTVSGVGYYDSEGRPVRQYLDAPLTLPPLASRAFVVEEEDRTGGVGASFLVEWDGPAGALVVEAVMIGTAGGQGISFVSAGRPVRAGDAPISGGEAAP